MKRACVSSGCETWANLEAFNPDNTPATGQRFRAQLQAVAADAAGITTYEWTTHWMPAGPSGDSALPLRSGYSTYLTTLD